MLGVEKPLAISEFTNTSNVLQINAHVDLIHIASFSKYTSQSFCTHLDEMSSVFIDKLDAAKCKIFNGSVLQIEPAVLRKNISAGAMMSQLRGNDSLADNKSYVIAVVYDAVGICSDNNVYSSEHKCFNDEALSTSRMQGVNDDMLHISISRSLWFNICQKYNITASTSQHQCILTKCIFTKSELPHSQSSTIDMQFASQLTISPILSPSYNLTALHDDILTCYFSKPRLMHIGDVFFIKSQVDDLLIYFKVQRILPMPVLQPCYVDNVHTTLFMDTAVQSFIPPPMSSAAAEILTVLSKYSMEICSHLHPFIERQKKMPPSSGLYPFILLSGPSGCGKSLVAKDVANRLHLHYFVIHCSSLISDTALAFEAKLKQALRLASIYKPCIVLLKSVNLIKDRTGQDDSRLAAIFFAVLRGTIDQETDQPSDSKIWPIAVIATVTADKLLSTELHQGFLHGIHMNIPDITERLLLLRSVLLDSITLSVDVQLNLIAQRTAGMVLGDIAALVNITKKMAKERIRELCTRADITDSLSWTREEEALVKFRSLQLIHADFEMALNNLQSAHADAIGAPKVPNVSWADVGGLETAKLDILDTIQLPLQHPELMAVGLNRSGILLYGPPGTGKTLLAKAVATECNINFLSVKGPELLNMYVGQSEENIREVFMRATAAAPCVIFFDELDSLAPNRGRSGDSGGVMDRVVSQLLSELDGLQKSTDIFVIGATNRPDLIDPALLRPGRFDKLIHLGVCSDKKSQMSILKALTRRFNLKPDCNMDCILERCEGYSLSGAELYAVCSDALLNAIMRIIDKNPSQDANDVQLQVVAEDFYKAMDSASFMQNSIES